MPPRLDYEMRPRYGPTVKWCDIPVTRVWRCGNRGNVASVLIEKPARGDFLPILDGGFSLQYSPLLEYREGRGLVLFCQLDVTGRTETDPAAETLARKSSSMSSTWKPAPEPEGRLCRRSGRDLPSRIRGHRRRMPIWERTCHPTTRSSWWARAEGGSSRPEHPAIAAWLKAGGNLLAIGLDEQDANAFLPFPVRMKKAEHISADFEPFDAGSLARRGWAGGRPQPRPPGIAPRHGRCHRHRRRRAGPGGGLQRRLLSTRAVAVRLRRASRTSSGRIAAHRSSCRACWPTWASSGDTPVLARFHTPVAAAAPERRWLNGLYLDQPEEWDDPYRFFRW